MAIDMPCHAEPGLGLIHAALQDIVIRLPVRIYASQNLGNRQLAPVHREVGWAYTPDQAVAKARLLRGLDRIGPGFHQQVLIKVGYATIGVDKTSRVKRG